MAHQPGGQQLSGGQQGYGAGPSNPYFDDEEYRRKHGWERRTKSGRLASEIERAELEYYFHIPVDVAAQQMGVGLTKLKSICRAYNIHRWPYRRVRRLQFLAQRMNSGLGTAQDHHDIRQLMAELGLPGSSPLWRNLEVDFERLQEQLRQFEGTEQRQSQLAQAQSVLLQQVQQVPPQPATANRGGTAGPSGQGGGGANEAELDTIAALHRLASAAAGEPSGASDDDEGYHGEVNGRGGSAGAAASPASSTQRPMGVAHGPGGGAGTGRRLPPGPAIVPPPAQQHGPRAGTGPRASTNGRGRDKYPPRHQQQQMQWRSSAPAMPVPHRGGHGHDRNHGSSLRSETRGGNGDAHLPRRSAAPGRAGGGGYSDSRTPSPAPLPNGSHAAPVGASNGGRSTWVPGPALPPAGLPPHAQAAAASDFFNANGLAAAAAAAAATGFAFSGAALMGSAGASTGLGMAGASSPLGEAFMAQLMNTVLRSYANGGIAPQQLAPQPGQGQRSGVDLGAAEEQQQHQQENGRGVRDVWQRDVKAERMEHSAEVMDREEDTDVDVDVSADRGSGDHQGKGPTSNAGLKRARVDVAALANGVEAKTTAAAVIVDGARGPDAEGDGAAASTTPEQREVQQLQQRKESSDSAPGEVPVVDESGRPDAGMQRGCSREEPNGKVLAAEERGSGGSAEATEPDTFDLLRRALPALAGTSLQQVPGDVQELMAPVFYKWLLEMAGAGRADTPAAPMLASLQAYSANHGHHMH